MDTYDVALALFGVEGSATIGKKNPCVPRLVSRFQLQLQVDLAAETISTCMHLYTHINLYAYVCIYPYLYLYLLLLEFIKYVNG